MMRMKESYDEGPATHIGPESCVFTREGSRADRRPGDEALTGVRIGRVSSRERRLKPRGLTSYGERKATRTRALQASPSPPLRGLRPRACAESSCAGTGRALDWPRRIDGGVVRNGNPKGVIR
jgi:RNA-directed DNA polymerase